MEMRPTVRRETRDTTPTITASRLRGVSGLRCSGGVCANASLGKKTRKNTILLLLSASHVKNRDEESSLHGHEADPLYADLYDAEKCSSTGSSRNLTTTCHIMLASRQDEDVCECGDG